jgi:hypothetical protein
VELPAKRRRDEDVNVVDERVAATKDALQSLPHKDSGYEASPQALRAIANRTDASRAAANLYREAGTYICSRSTFPSPGRI